MHGCKFFRTNPQVGPGKLILMMGGGGKLIMGHQRLKGKFFILFDNYSRKFIFTIKFSANKPLKNIHPCASVQKVYLISNNLKQLFSFFQQSILTINYMSKIPPQDETTKLRKICVLKACGMWKTLLALIVI